MKKIILTVSILASSFAVFSQKIAYVDSEYILGNIPEYKAAQAELDKTSNGWQKEVEAKADEPFGETVAVARSNARKRSAENPRSNGFTRIAQLESALLGPERDGDTDLVGLLLFGWSARRATDCRAMGEFVAHRQGRSQRACPRHVEVRGHDRARH